MNGRTFLSTASTTANIATRDSALSRSQGARGLLGALGAGLLLAGAAQVGAEELTLAWEGVSDSRLAGYELHYGTASGQYQHQVSSSTNYVTLAALEAGETYYFAVKSCSSDPSLDSALSDEISTRLAGPVPQAQFELDVASGVAPLTVRFSDTSSGAVESWSWDFGDGATSTDAAPSHVFSAPGVYAVSLLVSGPDGTSAQPATAQITVTEPAPEAAFSANITSGLAPLTVMFDSAGTTGAVESYHWDFGDGSQGSGAQAVWTYDEPGTYTVSLSAIGPGGEDTLTQTGLISVQGPPPVAEFVVEQTRGVAPLSVSFSNQSSGAVSTQQWHFGDGASSSEANPVHVYTAPGTYDVTLVVSGTYGSDTEVKTGAVVVESAGPDLEVGEVAVDHKWQWVGFEQAFVDPIVVAGPPSFNGADPSTVRIDGVSPEGFWIRVQEWDYLSPWHVKETVSYLVLERGVHTLPNGEQIEAGRLQRAASGGLIWDTVSFQAPFATTPVVLSTVSSENDPTAVTARLRGIDRSGFELRLDEQQAEQRNGHGAESIDYIAWEPSQGQIQGLGFLVGRTGTQVTDQRFGLDFGGEFTQAPAFLAHAQTTEGNDTAALRYSGLSAEGVTVWIEEEQSGDAETGHVAEDVGYILFD